MCVPPRASLALAQLPSACTGEARVIQTSEFGNDPARAFSYAAETVNTVATPMCSFQLHLESAIELFETKKRAAGPAARELAAEQPAQRAQAAAQQVHVPAAGVAADAALQTQQYRELAQK